MSGIRTLITDVFFVHQERPEYGNGAFYKSGEVSSLC